MKLNIELDTSDGEAVDELIDMLNWQKYKYVCSDVYEYARKLRKYEEREQIPTQEVHKTLFEMIIDD